MTITASGFNHSFFQETRQGIVITIYVQPRSSRNKIIGIHGNAIKIAVQSPPVDDAANRMCVEFLSKCLNINRSSFEIVSGHTSRTKRILLRFSSDNDVSAQSETYKHLILSLLAPASSERLTRCNQKTT